jgi:protein SEY1
MERKLALFALATTSVLIVNIWEKQVGLFSGGCVGLLKTIIQAWFDLFGQSNEQYA